MRKKHVGFFVFVKLYFSCMKSKIHRVKKKAERIGLLYIKYSKFWSVSLEHFVEQKALVLWRVYTYEEKRIKGFGGFYLDYGQKSIMRSRHWDRA